MRRLLRPFALCALALAADRPSSADAPAGSGPLVPIPVGVPVALDGAVLAEEWGAAAPCPTSGGGPELRAQQLRGTWLLALGTAAPWPASAHLTLYARAGSADGSILAPGTVWIDVEPREHNRPHVLVRVRAADGVSWTSVEGQVVARFATLDTRAAAEIAISLPMLGVAAASRPPLRWLAIFAAPSAAPVRHVFPAGLDVSGTAGRPLGPDLESSARWARTVDWPQADAKGAYSATEWAALVDADAALTRLGARAYARILPADRDPAAEPAGAETGKVDAPIVADVVDGFREIGAREALTSSDLRILALGLRALNRAPEAVALLEASVFARRADAGVDDLLALADASSEAERFELAARAYEAASALAIPRLATSHVGAAANARRLATAFAAEQAARAEDAAQDDQPLVRLRTSKGDVYLRLLEDDVPQAVAQFVHLAEEAKAEDGAPFYAGTLFHAVEAGHRALGGDPTTRAGGCAAGGSGGSAWWVAPERNARHRCFRGAVAFDTAAESKVRSRFFVLTGPRPELEVPVFATVVGGMDVVDRLEACDRLLRVDVLRKRAHPYAPKKGA